MRRTTSGIGRKKRPASPREQAKGDRRVGSKPSSSPVADTRVSWRFQQPKDPMQPKGLAAPKPPKDAEAGKARTGRQVSTLLGMMQRAGLTGELCWSAPPVNLPSVD